MKKIMFLGGAPAQLPPIRYALEQGYFVITADYLPENPGHKLAHRYYNISTIEKDAVLKVARTENIDGIVAYASDPGAPTAAYVAEKLGLPGNPYSSVETLTRKDLFREFLEKYDFNVPSSKSFYDEAKARQWLEHIGVPAFIKPVDSSGSKGVTHIESVDQLSSAFRRALVFSHEKKVVVEKKIERHGYQVDSDIFVYDGEIIFWAWGNQHQDIYCHPYAPVAISYPSVLPTSLQEKAKQVVSSILTKLGFVSGAFNVEFVIDKNEDIWVIEIGPRNGGNLIPQVLKYATGVDTIAATVEAAVGNAPSAQTMQKPVTGFWSSVIVHSSKKGKFKKLAISERVKNYIVEKNMYVSPGDQVRKFSGSNDTLGTMILKYPTQKEMLHILDNMSEDIEVVVE